MLLRASARERPVLLVVDQRSSMFFGSERDMKSVTAARLGIAEGDEVEIEPNEGGELLAEVFRTGKPFRGEVRVLPGDNAVDIGEQTAFLVTGLFREFEDASHPEVAGA